MNTKIKHRILGILVVIGLVVLLLPLFQSSKDIPSERTVVKAPPFPDQAAEATQVNSTTLSENTSSPQPDDTISNNHLSVASNDLPKLPKPENLVLPEASKSEIKTVANTQEENTIAANKVEANKPEANIAEPNKPAMNTAEIKKLDTNEVTPNELNPAIKTSQETPKNNLKIQTKVASIHSDPIVKSHNKKVKRLARNHTKIHSIPLPHDNNGLAKLKGAVWVVQIGNFKNKTKALNLVNHLRTQGYPAFIQQVSTAFGTSTRVFVGPEYKLNTASQLADRLEKQIHIHGVVLSYQPLSM